MRSFPSSSSFCDPLVVLRPLFLGGFESSAKTNRKKSDSNPKTIRNKGVFSFGKLKSLSS